MCRYPAEANIMKTTKMTELTTSEMEAISGGLQRVPGRRGGGGLLLLLLLLLLGRRPEPLPPK
jgi:bacteriocin-like protein